MSISDWINSDDAGDDGREAAEAAALEKGKILGALAERDRFRAVLTSDAGRRDPASAIALALAGAVPGEGLDQKFADAGEARRIARRRAGMRS